MEKKSQARLEILSYLFQFGMARMFNSGTPFVSDSCCFRENRSPAIGALVSPQHTRGGHKWYIGWLVEIEYQSGGNVYHIESLEDGQVCRWENVSIQEFSPDTVAKFPQWKWSDKQFKLEKQWNRACYKTRDAYILRPNMIEFKEDGSVTVSMRKMFNHGDPPPVRIFQNFKEVKVSDLLKYYDDCMEWNEVNK